MQPHVSFKIQVKLCHGELNTVLNQNASCISPLLRFQCIIKILIVSKANSILVLPVKIIETNNCNVKISKEIIKSHWI